MLRGQVDPYTQASRSQPTAPAPEAAAPPRPTPVLTPRPVPAPEPLVLRPVEPVAVDQPLFVTPLAETSPAHGTSPSSNPGRLPAGLAAALRKMDPNTPADVEHSLAHDPSTAARSKSLNVGSQAALTRRDSD